MSKTIAALAILAMLAACGTHRGERALSGAAVGAGAGALSAALLGGNVRTGVVAGGRSIAAEEGERGEGERAERRRGHAAHSDGASSESDLPLLISARPQ